MLSYRIDRMGLGRERPTEIAFVAPCECGTLRTVTVRSASGIFPTSLQVRCSNCGFCWEGDSTERLSDWAERGDAMDFWISICDVLLRAAYRQHKKSRAWDFYA